MDARQIFLTLGAKKQIQPKLSIGINVDSLDVNSCTILGRSITLTMRSISGLSRPARLRLTTIIRIPIMHYLFALGLIFLSFAAHAMRNVDFAPAVVPDSGHIVLPVLAEGKLTPGGATANGKAGDAIAQAIADAGFQGEAGEVLTLRRLAPYTRVDLVGVGGDALSQSALQDFGGSAAMLQEYETGEDIHVLSAGLTTEIAQPAAHIALGFQLGDYAFTEYKSEAREGTPGNVVLLSEQSEAAERLYRNDKVWLAESVVLARNLGSEPGNVLYPEIFVERARAAFKGVRDVSIEVLDGKQMQRLNMGALLGVGRGSTRPPRLMIIRYQGGQGDATDFALVGKGITFDTGGISLKPNRGMWLMKSDMSGAAAVTAAALALAKRQAPVNVVAIAALAENMPSGDAIRPGDVLTTMSGKTVEIMSTDAEGRLVLADAVYYAQNRFKPKMLIDIATLTGSAVRALGDDYGALFTRDEAIQRQLVEAGKTSGETVWPLPLNAGHYIQLDSLIADVKNTADKPPGASTGAAFIGNFIAENQPWAHLDIAGVDWREEPLPTVPVGHAGWGVRFLDQVVRASIHP